MTQVVDRLHRFHVSILNGNESGRKWIHLLENDSPVCFQQFGTTNSESFYYCYGVTCSEAACTEKLSHTTLASRALAHYNGCPCYWVWLYFLCEFGRIAQRISLRSVCSSPKGTESEGFLFSPRHFSALPAQRRWPYFTLGLAGALSLLSIHRRTVSPSPHTSCASSPDLTEGKWVLMIFLISPTSRDSSGRGLRVFCVINVFRALHHVLISISSSLPELLRQVYLLLFTLPFFTSCLALLPFKSPFPLSVWVLFKAFPWEMPSYRREERKKGIVLGKKEHFDWKAFKQGSGHSVQIKRGKYIFSKILIIVRYGYIFSHCFYFSVSYPEETLSLANNGIQLMMLKEKTWVWFFFFSLCSH